MQKNIRPIRIEGNIAYVPLYGGGQAIIDAADLKLVDGLLWHGYNRLGPNGEVLSTYARNCVYVGGYRSKVTHMHRLILQPKDGEFVDHIDGNGLNNRRCNLRVANKSQNACNSKIRCDNRSGYKGVSKMPGRSTWRARIRVCGKAKTIGYFPTPEEAAAAYAKASAELHGEFGRTD